MFLSFSGNIDPLLYKRKTPFDCVPHASDGLSCKNFAPICDFKMPTSTHNTNSERLDSYFGSSNGDHNDSFLLICGLFVMCVDL